MQQTGKITEYAPVTPENQWVFPKIAYVTDNIHTQNYSLSLLHLIAMHI